MFNGSLQVTYIRCSCTPSQGFIIDILSDSKGVSVHRLQNVLWMVAAGGLYIYSVATNFSLPDPSIISNQLLLLMGISNGTYIGIKVTENSRPVSETKDVTPKEKAAPDRPELQIAADSTIDSPK